MRTKKIWGRKNRNCIFFPSFAHSDDFCPPFVCSGIFHYCQIILELLAYRVDRLWWGFSAPAAAHQPTKPHAAGAVLFTGWLGQNLTFPKFYLLNRWHILPLKMSNSGLARLEISKIKTAGASYQKTTSMMVLAVQFTWFKNNKYFLFISRISQFQMSMEKNCWMLSRSLYYLLFKYYSAVQVFPF